MAKAEPALEPGRNCWRIERADAAQVIVDADDYFRVARRVMMAAQHQLLLVGWDFDTRIKLVQQADDDAPLEIGELIDWLVARNPRLQVYILRWDTGALKALGRGRTLLKLAKWWRHDRIHLKLDQHHPTGASHHQKIVVADDRFAFCGGIDMTDDRWDTREHRDDEPCRVEPNGSAYGPWHDATTALSGPVAQSLGDLCRARWARAGGGDVAAPPAMDRYWPDDLPQGFMGCEVAISRTLPEMADQAPVYEIEQLYLDLIARAERWIYAESQYFASRRIAEAIARRLSEPDGPEIVIINPVRADGWLEQEAMDSARARLLQVMRNKDPHNRLGVFHPETINGTPIYVHAKVTVVDGEILRVGSSNFNNRSLGLDSECDITIDTTRAANAGCRNAVAHVAHDLLAEHLGCTAQEVDWAIDRTGSVLEAIRQLDKPGRRLRPYAFPDLNGVEEWLADNEILDPETPDEMFEPLSNKGLYRHLRRPTSRPVAIAQIAIATSTAVAVVAGAAAIWRGIRRR